MGYRMHIDARLLTLTQWLSPSYPLGSFAFSHGLEQAVREGWVFDDETLSSWLSDVALFGSGWSDAIWIRLAYAAQDAAELGALNSACRAFAPSQERRREGERQGQAFARVTSDVWHIALPPLQFSIAIGRAASLADLPLAPVVTLYLQAFLANLVSAAQRLMPLGQTQAQQVLADLNMLCLQIEAETQGLGLDDITSSAFLSDIAAMRHETLQPRIFQS
jgi:urease accessory protein